ncbi:alpha/beta hydrolase, partial [Streptomyces sp. NPDC050636]|uniref:alpha/beta fold hydrolase n=1 Tax=Streptomyces sp. NPDC050636 TaxID=3154510 RepID=UPI003439AC84
PRSSTRTVIRTGPRPLSPRSPTPIVLCHGFPELGFSWRHQVFALAEAGYRVLVPDMRGYGGSSRPADPEAYDMRTLCADLAGLLDDIGAEDAVFVGHDWGAVVVWNMAWHHPERVRAVAGMSVPVTPRSPEPPLATLRSSQGDDFYMVWFQEPGVADRALRQNVRRTMVTREIYSAAWAARPDEGFPPPAWLSDDDLAYYVRAFERTGFTGGLNYYRNLDRNWALSEHLEGRLITQPSFFLIGSQDPVGKFTPTHHLDKVLTDLRENVVLEGAGHWVQQERAQEVSDALLRFLTTLDLKG